MTAVLGIISQIKDAVKDNDMMKAQTLGTNLDEAIDPLKDVIKDKNPDLVKSMDVEVLMDMMKATPEPVRSVELELAQGTITAQSKVGQETKFIARLPKR